MVLISFTGAWEAAVSRQDGGSLPTGILCQLWRDQHDRGEGETTTYKDKITKEKMNKDTVKSDIRDIYERWDRRLKKNQKREVNVKR